MLLLVFIFIYADLMVGPNSGSSPSGPAGRNGAPLATRSPPDLSLPTGEPLCLCCVFTHTHTHVRTHTVSHAHTHIHTHKQTHKQNHTHIQTYAHLHSDIEHMQPLSENKRKELRGICGVCVVDMRQGSVFPLLCAHTHFCISIGPNAYSTVPPMSCPKAWDHGSCWLLIGGCIPQSETHLSLG